MARCAPSAPLPAGQGTARRGGGGGGAARRWRSGLTWGAAVAEGSGTGAARRRRRRDKSGAAHPDVTPYVTARGTRPRPPAHPPHRHGDAPGPVQREKGSGAPPVVVRCRGSVHRDRAAAPGAAGAGLRGGLRAPVAFGTPAPGTALIVLAGMVRSRSRGSPGRVPDGSCPGKLLRSRGASPRPGRNGGLGGPADRGATAQQPLGARGTGTGGTPRLPYTGTPSPGARSPEAALCVSPGCSPRGGPLSRTVSPNCSSPPGRSQGLDEHPSAPGGAEVWGLRTPPRCSRWASGGAKRVRKPPDRVLFSSRFSLLLAR